jgi:hypothetical protein
MVQGSNFIPFSLRKFSQEPERKEWQLPSPISISKEAKNQNVLI